MITGYNTDVEYGGVTYHVQTEDKGLQTPMILTLLYVGGAILASKRTPYDDLVASGINEDVLRKRLERQHKLICAAVHAGRIEERGIVKKSLRRIGVDGEVGVDERTIEPAGFALAEDRTEDFERSMVRVQRGRHLVRNLNDAHFPGTLDRHAARTRLRGLLGINLRQGHEGAARPRLLD